MPGVQCRAEPLSGKRFNIPICDEGLVRARNCPRLDETSGGLLPPAPVTAPLRWALVTMTAALLMSIPIYEHMRKPTTLTESVTNFQAENAVNRGQR